jgi:hypothetical protein
MRVAFTIILNGLHHLKHNNFYQNMVENFDKWIIVEGVSLPNGSTNWCKNLPNNFHKNFLSNDGTTEFLDIYRHPKIEIIRPVDEPWHSKDQQVNAGITSIKKTTNECFLWQVDVDEQWNIEDLIQSEKLLKLKGGKTGCFLCNYFAGPNQIVKGGWGEGMYEPYRRLWDWKGEMFKTHEPPTLDGKNGPGLLLPAKFNHYAYYFEQDIKFKEQYYGYEGLHERWKMVQNNKDRLPIKSLLGDKVWWSTTQTSINYMDDSRWQ